MKHSIRKYTLLLTTLCQSGLLSAQEDASFSGISADSAIKIVTEAQPEEQEPVYETSVGIGHTNADMFYLHSFPETCDEGSTLSFHLNSLQFTRDAEYFLPETKGYTAVGSFVEPTLKLRMRGWEWINVEAGAQILGIAGDDHQLHVNPIFRIEYKPQDWLRLVGGTIYGNLNHGLYEPMYDFDRFFYNNQEDGLQVMIDKDFGHIRIKSDTWLNWENFLEPGEAEQEKFTIGSSNRIKIGNENRKMVQIPIDIMGTHRGGQFTSLQDTCLETLFNVCTGLDWAISRRLRATALLFGYKNNSNEIWTTYRGGFGVYPMVTYYSKNQTYFLTAGYWYGNKYIGTRGSYLFQYRSKYDPEFVQAQRSMLTAKWFYTKGIFGMEAQAYYDLKENKTDFSFGIYLKFCKDFGLIDKDL